MDGGFGDIERVAPDLFVRERGHSPVEDFVAEPSREQLVSLLASGRAPERSELREALQLFVERYRPLLAQTFAICRLDLSEKPALLERSQQALPLLLASLSERLFDRLRAGGLTIDQVEADLTRHIRFLSTTLAVQLQASLSQRQLYEMFFAGCCYSNRYGGDSYSALRPFVEGRDWPEGRLFVRAASKAMQAVTISTEPSVLERRVFAAVCAEAWPEAVSAYLAATRVNHRSWDCCQVWSQLYQLPA